MRPTIGDEQIKITITITRRSPQQNCHAPSIQYGEQGRRILNLAHNVRTAGVTCTQRVPCSRHCGMVFVAPRPRTRSRTRTRRPHRLPVTVYGPATGRSLLSSKSLSGSGSSILSRPARLLSRWGRKIFDPDSDPDLDFDVHSRRQRLKTFMKSSLFRLKKGLSSLIRCCGLRTHPTARLIGNGPQWRNQDWTIFVQAAQDQLSFSGKGIRLRVASQNAGTCFNPTLKRTLTRPAYPLPLLDTLTRPDV